MAALRINQLSAWGETARFQSSRSKMDFLPEQQLWHLVRLTTFLEYAQKFNNDVSHLLILGHIDTNLDIF